jgi:serine/threonine-protein kinase
VEERTGTTLLGKYELNGLLGRGGMGSVYRGIHLRTGRKIAVKILDERYLANASIVQRFGREARAASAIEHPGIVEVLDLDVLPEGAPFLVMELLDGETLASLIKRKVRLSQEEALEVFEQLLEALEAAHERGIVHRDLKPDNIFLLPPSHSGRRVVKILDFGISQKADEVRSHLTQTGSVLGTPHYMSPEQALGEVALDARADVYAAAVVLYECVVGDVPFDAGNYNALLQSILRATPQRPRERGALISPTFEEALLAGMRRDREKRPASAAAFRTWLVEAAAGRAAGSSTGDRPSLPQPGAEGGASGGADTSWGGFDTLGAAPGKRVSTTPTGGARPDAARAPGATGASSGKSGVRVGSASPSVSSPSFDDFESRAGEGGPALELDDAALASQRSRGASATPGRTSDPAVTPTPAGGGRAVTTPLPTTTSEPASPGRTSTPAEPGEHASRPSAPTAAASTGEAEVLAEAPPPGRALSGNETSLQLAASTLAARRASASRSYHRLPSRGGDSFAPGAKRRSGLLGWIDGLPGPVRIGSGVALAILLVVVAIRVAVQMTTEPAKEPVLPPPAAPTPVAQAEPTVDSATVLVNVTGIPPGARVRLDGLPVGTLPVRMRRGEAHVFVIEARGYERREIPVTPERDLTIPAELRVAR